MVIMWVYIVGLVVCQLALTSAQLSLPKPELCANRRKDITFGNHNYLLSWKQRDTNFKYTWINGRNFCRERCMDLVSLETPQEDKFITNQVVSGRQRYIWTSGRLCNFPGCDQPHLLPKNINGWFWSGSMELMGPTTDRKNNWGTRGRNGKQPDEGDGPGTEACLGILSWDVYSEPGNKYTWHDIGCHHEKPIVCEDSDELINFVKSRNPNLRL